jgi:putative transcriptional regulator
MMNDEHMVRARRRPDGQLEEILPDGSTRILKGDTDWARLAAMTEEEIQQNALDDPDNPPRTTEELARMPRIPNPKVLRERLNLTQEEFARQFHIWLRTLQEWEQNERMPDSTAIAYLRVIERIPDAVRQALIVDPIAPTATVVEPREKRVS